MRFVMSMLLFLLATAAQAAEFQIKSRIDNVTVFPRGAEVRRVAKAQLSKGAHVMILSDLPADVDLNSIRIEGKATGAFDIGGVDARRIQVLRKDSQAQQSQRRQIENDIERENDRLDVLQAEIEVLEIKKRYIENLATLPTTGASLPQGERVRPHEDWAQLLNLIGTSLTDVHQSILKHNLQVRENIRRIEDLKKKLTELAPQQIQRTEARVNVIVDEELMADLVVRYRVPKARWQPLYDARLQTGSRNVPSQLILTRRAAITQNTGETWENVTIELSTARPNGRSGTPEIYPVIVDFDTPPQPIDAPMAESKKKRLRQAVSGSLGNGFRELTAANRKPFVSMREREANVDIGSYQAMFKIPGRATIKNTGDAKQIKIETISLEPSLLVRSVPKFDTRAYLYAKMTLPKGITPILPGQTMLFRDHTFIGKGYMPQLAGGEEHELGFGVDDAIRVKYTKVAESRGETGLISSSRTDQRRFKIAIKNLHERPINYSILDQRPESVNKDIKVELAGLTKPIKQNVKGHRGVIAWEGKLVPDQEYIIDFGYIVAWPADKQIRYSR